MEKMLYTIHIGFVAGFDVLVMHYFLNVSILEGKVMPKSDSVLDVGRQETTRHSF